MRKGYVTSKNILKIHFLTYRNVQTLLNIVLSQALLRKNTFRDALPRSVLLSLGVCIADYLILICRYYQGEYKPWILLASQLKQH